MPVVDTPATTPTPSPANTPAWRIEPLGDTALLVRSAHLSYVQPEDWRDRLRASLQRFIPSGVAAVGVKRLAAAGDTFSMGEFIVHPKGFHHVGQGLPGHALRFPEETDVIAGGLLAVERAAFDRVNGRDALHGELGGVELCLRLRALGRRCITVPDVAVTDQHSPSPTDEETLAFVKRWGFDWRAADLDVVRNRYATSGLLWNVRLHGVAMPFEKYQQRPAMHWKSYAETPVYRQRADHLTVLAAKHIRDGEILDLGCGDGLFSHLLAMAGRAVVGVDLEAQGIEQARAQCSSQQYPGAGPRFEHVGAGPLPFVDQAFTGVVLFDVIEHLPNPVAVLREVRRVLRAGGTLVVSTPAWQFGHSSDPVYHMFEYSMDELTRQLAAVTDFHITATGTIGGVYRDLVVVACCPG